MKFQFSFKVNHDFQFNQLLILKIIISVLRNNFVDEKSKVASMKINLQVNIFHENWLAQEIEWNVDQKIINFTDGLGHLKYYLENEINQKNSK